MGAEESPGQECAGTPVSPPDEWISVASPELRRASPGLGVYAPKTWADDSGVEPDLLPWNATPDGVEPGRGSRQEARDDWRTLLLLAVGVVAVLLVIIVIWLLVTASGKHTTTRAEPPESIVASAAAARFGDQSLRSRPFTTPSAS